MTPEPRDLLRGLNARERAVLSAIYEHKVLLTEHLKVMFFGSLRRAQDRLRHLARRGADRHLVPAAAKRDGQGIRTSHADRERHPGGGIAPWRRAL
jgi:hypothetical protein